MTLDEVNALKMGDTMTYTLEGQIYGPYEVFSIRPLSGMHGTREAFVKDLRGPVMVTVYVRPDVQRGGAVVGGSWALVTKPAKGATL